jgi:predicted PurR-regulated permease PerM
VLTLDQRTTSILTTIAAYAAVVAVVLVAHATLAAFVVGLLLAYLLEPIVAGVERLLPSGWHARGVAIAVVYVIATVIVVIAGYSAAPTVANQFRRLATALPEVTARINEGGITSRSDLISSVTSRASQAAVSAVEDAAWLLVAPVVAIFFLGNRARYLDGAVDLLARRADRTRAKRTIQQVDQALAEYTRGQVVLAGLSAAFYGVCMVALGIPYALALALLGGALEFVPAVGWMAAAVAILASASHAHAHWIWMAVLIVAWRLLQNFANSPRVMGDRLRLEPMTVLFALMIGSQIDGLAGAILSIPAVAVWRVIWMEDVARDTSPVALVKP